ncbi:MAG: ArsA family ATPase [Bradymonadaceae bacterium]|nr:ArsA family ATPase [Lujinxingiaceae bacterium]
MKPSATQSFSKLIANRKVVVCVGSGGVGKTTTSAVIALHAAIEGRKVLVLTIDPARRLANSLGVTELGNDIQQIPLDQFRQIGLEPKGELWAMMLDMKLSFDHLVATYAPDAKTRDEILDNRFYQYFSTSLAGTQEYAASERLHELYMRKEFDLIVLDTPPTSHALDFLEAPNRLADAVSGKALQWMYKPGAMTGRSGLGLFSVGTSYVIKTLGRFTGAQLLNDLSVFLRTFSTLFEGFEQRARKVQSLLLSDKTAFVVVTAPDTLTIEEALYFYERLGTSRLHVGGFVVNRVHPMWVSAARLDAPAEQLSAELQALAKDLPAPAEAIDFDALASRLLENAVQFQLRATQDEHSIALLDEELPGQTPVVTVPYFSLDIHSLEGLDQARRALFE